LISELFYVKGAIVTNFFTSLGSGFLLISEVFEKSKIFSV